MPDETGRATTHDLRDDMRRLSTAGAVDCDVDIVRLAPRARRRNALAAVATVIVLRPRDFEGSDRTRAGGR